MRTYQPRLRIPTKPPRTSVVVLQKNERNIFGRKKQKAIAFLHSGFTLLARIGVIRLLVYLNRKSEIAAACVGAAVLWSLICVELLFI